MVETNLENEKVKRKLDNISEAKYFETINKNKMSYNKVDLAIFRAGFFSAMMMVQSGEVEFKKEQEQKQKVEWKGKEFDIPRLEGEENAKQ